MPIALNQYIFGNSLVNFAGGAGQTNVPYWLDQFAEAADGDYNVNGGYGFLRQFADREEPASEWGFAGVGDVWNADLQDFAEAQFDSVMITPANFIQDSAPDAAYPGDDRSPLDATLDVIDQVMTEQPGARIFIYQGWADMGALFPDFPPTSAQLASYYDYAGGAYQDWFDAYLDAIRAAAPGADVQIVPVNDVLVDLLSEGGPLADLTAEELFVDTAPHGTETTYYLASMITYSTLYGEPVSADAPMPEGLHPLVAANLPALADYIHGAVGDAIETPADPSDGGTDDPVPQPDPQPDPDPEPDTGDGEAGYGEARDDALQANPDGVTVIDALANDVGADGLIISAVGQPAHGTAEITDNLIAYRPDEGFAGTDTFTYDTMTADGIVTSATIMVDVVGDGAGPVDAPPPDDGADAPVPEPAPNTAPRARRDEVETDGETIRIDALANDIDRDGDAISLLSVGAADHGAARIVDGRIEYTPDAGFVGQDKLSYAIVDARGAVDGGRILIDVTAAEDAEILAAFATTPIGRDETDWAESEDAPQDEELLV